MKKRTHKDVWEKLGCEVDLKEENNHVKLFLSSLKAFKEIR